MTLHYVEDIIAILLLDSFIELPASNQQNLGKSKDSFVSPGHAKQEKNATYRRSRQRFEKI